MNAISKAHLNRETLDPIKKSTVSAQPNSLAANIRRPRAKNSRKLPGVLKTREPEPRKTERAKVSQREIDRTGGEKKPNQINWSEEEKQTQNKTFKKRLKWSRAEKKKWVQREKPRSKTEDFTGKSASLKVSLPNYGHPSSSSFTGGPDKRKGAKRGSGRHEQGAVTNANTKEVVGSMVECNPMDESHEEIHICSSKEKEDLILCIGKGVKMKLSTKTANTLLKELRIFQGIEHPRTHTDKAIEGVVGVLDKNVSRIKQIVERGGDDCSSSGRIPEETRRDVMPTISEEEVEARNESENLFLPPPVWECDEVPGVDIPLAAVGAVRMEDQNVSSLVAEGYRDNIVRSAEEMGEIMGLSFSREDGLDLETFHSIVQEWDQSNSKTSSSRKGERELKNLISYVNYDGRNDGKRERSCGGRRGEGRGKELVCYEA